MGWAGGATSALRLLILSTLTIWDPSLVVEARHPKLAYILLPPGSSTIWWGGSYGLVKLSLSVLCGYCWLLTMTTGDLQASVRRL